MQTEKNSKIDLLIISFRKKYPTGYITTQIIKDENDIFGFKVDVGFYENEKKHELANYIVYIKEKSKIEELQQTAMEKALEIAGFKIGYGLPNEKKQKTTYNNEQYEKTEYVGGIYLYSLALLKSLPIYYKLLGSFIYLFLIIIYPIFSISFIIGILTGFLLKFCEDLKKDIDSSSIKKSFPKMMQVIIILTFLYLIMCMSHIHSELGVIGYLIGMVTEIIIRVYSKKIILKK